MREVKFRGLNRNSNTWYYGSLLVTRQLGIYHAQIWLLDEDYPVPVDIETTGEWIGLTDKVGKEIYDGDIVKAEDWWEEPHTFIWPEDMYWVIECSLEKRLEVIGNCYENPDLLQKGSS